MELRVCGWILSGDVRRGCIVIRDGMIREIEEGEKDGDISGIIIPCFTNLHTHVGDCMIKDPPYMPLSKLVGRGGLKYSSFGGAEEIRNVLCEALMGGCWMLADFREEGIDGAKKLQKAASGLPIGVRILGRPDGCDAEDVLKVCDGFGISSMDDYPFETLCDMREICRRSRKLFAIHACEERNEDVEKILSLEPHFLVHMTNAGERELKMVADEGVPVAVCIRSNLVSGVGIPPVRKMVELGIKVGIGTDNVMLNSPDMFREMEILSKMLLRDDGKVLEMATVGGAEILGEKLDIREGAKARLMVMDSEGTLRGCDPLRGVVRRGGRENIAAIIIENQLIRPSRSWVSLSGCRKA